MKKNNDFPSIKVLISETFEVFKKSFLKLFVVNVLNFITFAIVGLLGAILLGLGLGLNIFKDFSFISALSTSWIIVFGGFVVLISLLLLTIYQISVYLIVSKKKEYSLVKIIKNSFSLIIPFFFVQLLVSFFSIGGAFLFFFPFWILVFFLMFAKFETVLGDKRGLNAVKSSVQIITQNFWEILGRKLLYLVFHFSIMFIAFFPLNLINRTFKDSVGLLMGLMLPVYFLNFFIGIILSWVSLSFSFVLYKQAKKRKKEKKITIIWMWIIAVMGWLILGAILFSIYKVSKSDSFKKIFSQKKDNSKQDFTFIPSSCGLSIPVPETNDIQEGEERKWIYEEVSLSTSEFYVLDNDLYPIEVLLGSFIGYKTEEERLEGDNFLTSYPGLNIYCTDNYKSLNLEEYKSLALVNKNYQVKAEDIKVRWGEVDLVPILLEGNKDGRQIKEPAYLGISKDGKRLLYIRIWAVPEDDSFYQQIKDSTDTIIDNLKYREVKENLIDIQKKINLHKNFEKTVRQKKTEQENQAKPSCIQYPIREGEFASNKCYSQQDYNDLIYYLQQFNNSAFSFNGAVASMEITCSGSDFFKDSCERDKQRKQQAEQDMNQYRAEINAIIAKGQ